MDRLLKSYRSCNCSWGLLALMLVCTGCNSQSAQMTEARERLVAKNEPAEISSLQQSYDNFQVGQIVTVAGMIYASDGKPFDPKESAFTIVDLLKAGHDHEDPGDCPFCKHELKSKKVAIVLVTDTSGNPYKQSADALLGLRNNMRIVVTGTTAMVGETMVINPKQIVPIELARAAELSKQFYPVEQ
jgi:hypothetical protein